ncbi:MAG TPA: CVNH domain-containing protein [Thermodesulfobacteriota bacterium]|nr:CVNH domain-containing protein [Thermodesulfobacteriota bacterium]
MYFVCELCDIYSGDISNNDGYLTCEKTNAPPGSYQQSCVNISVSGTTLQAFCKYINKYGEQHWRSINFYDYDLCSDDISNFHGYITCVKTNVPRGSYLDSCISASKRYGELKAMCRTINGELKETTLNDTSDCTADISNNDGNLTCERTAELPAGSYLQTCTNPSLDDTRLTALCEKRGGGNRSTTLEEIDRCTGDISNYDGYLTCRKTGEVPSGSYQQSCINPSITSDSGGRTLRALCRTISEDTNATSLREPDSCVGDISNNDGHLICRKD